MPPTKQEQQEPQEPPEKPQMLRCQMVWQRGGNDGWQQDKEKWMECLCAPKRCSEDVQGAARQHDFVV
jgi:hypothetical protein